MKNNIFNIKANYNFLESLSCWVIDKYGKDPIYLSQVTILLPSRRACRAFRDIILKQYKKNSIILPKIKAIGDIDIEEISLNIENITELEDFQKYSKSFLKYHSLLIEEIRSFNKKTNLFGKNPTTNQLNLIAKNLEEFLNEIDREELNLDNLENIDDADIASHKQKILLFLRNFGSNWRNILRKYQIKSETSYQNQLIDFYCQYLKNKEDNFSIIAAGSTGSLKSTSRLLKQIQKIENGFIFISSLDREISNDIFQNLTETHPQFMLKKLLDTLKISRSEICDIEFGNFQQRNTNLSKLLSYSSLPAEKTDIWTKINDITENNIENFNLIECKNTSDEATAIAIIILKELEKKDNNIALITKDKNLAKTVKNLLFRFNVNIDDSKNNNLAESEAAQYLISIANLFNSDFKVSNLLSILKHKITRAGFEDIFYYHNLRLFELKIIRENFSLKNLEIISKRVKEFSNSDLEKWFDKIINILNIFNNIKDEDNFLEISKKNLECARELSKNYQNNILLKDLNGTENIEIFINEIKDNISTFKVEYEVYCKILKDFLSNYSLEEKQNHHPRLNILSPIEARIMNFETIIVSNLNEGEFGKQAPSQNWLSKKMRLDFGLHDLSRDNGVGGFDFANYLGNKNIYLTRSLSNNNSPTEKSHHLLKLETVIKAANIDDNFKNNHYWNSLSKNFYGEIKKEEDINIKIQARPPLFNSLEKVSVTDFSKWLRDPYYIYAKRILKLKSLNNIESEASFASFGNFTHETLENFIKDYENLDKKDLEKQLLKYGKKYFSKYFLNIDNHILWWPRFENIAKWFIKNEIKNRKNIKKSITELPENLIIDKLKISTKIDRINFDINNQIQILDYKTGTLPKNIDIKNGIEPQLAIEALIFLEKNNLDLEFIDEIGYYELKGRDKNKINYLKNNKELIEAARDGIEELIRIFNRTDTPFYACPNPEIYKDNEYKHLARIT